MQEKLSGLNVEGADYGVEDKVGPCLGAFLDSLTKTVGNFWACVFAMSPNDGICLCVFVLRTVVTGRTEAETGTVVGVLTIAVATVSRWHFAGLSLLSSRAEERKSKRLKQQSIRWSVDVLCCVFCCFRHTV